MLCRASRTVLGFCANCLTLFPGNPNRLCTTGVKSRLWRPFSSNTSCVRVARMMISVQLPLHEHQSLRDRPESNCSCDAGQWPQTVRLNVQFNRQSLHIPSLTSEVCSSCDVGTPKNTLQTGCFCNLSRHHRRCSPQRPCTALY